MKKLTLILLLFYGSMLWASDHFETQIQRVTQELRQMTEKMKPQPHQTRACGACLLPNELLFQTSIKEKNERFVWYLLPEYWFDDEVDSSGAVKRTTLDYCPIEKVFNLFPALYGLWMAEPSASLIQYSEDFISAAKSMGGSSYEELINHSECYYADIPGINFCYRYRSNMKSYVWFSHLLWKDHVGYNVFFLTRESDYNSSLNQTYFKLILSLVSFAQDAAVSSAPLTKSPETFTLQQNFPNPFNGTTMIRFQLNQATSLQLMIFNTLGQEIRTYALDYPAPGQYEWPWDGRNNDGEQVPSGIYFYRLQSEHQQRVKEMSFIK